MPLSMEFPEPKGTCRSCEAHSRMERAIAGDVALVQRHKELQDIGVRHVAKALTADNSCNSRKGRRYALLVALERLR